MFLEVLHMFAIQPINKFYTNKRYVGIRANSNLPYPVYDGNPDCPKDIHGFETKESALDYLTKFVNREGIDVVKLSISEIVDISLINNSNQFQIIEYEIEDNKLKVLNTYPQPQFTREGWYKV